MNIFLVLCVLVAAVTGDVSHLGSTEYLPPSHQYAASKPSVSYSAPATQSYHVEAASIPDVSYSAPQHIEAASAPVVSYSAPVSSSESYNEVAASEPAHSYSAAEGYRYKTVKRRVLRRQRRDVSHLSSEYLPPAASEQVVQYESAPSYAAAASEPAVAYEAASYEGAASEPAHSYSSADGYRYKSVKRRVLRRQRRDVNHLSSDYLPPAASEQVVQYESAPSYSAAASEPAVAYETASYEGAASEPAHSYSSADGYRYKSVKRRVLRRQRRDVSHLSSDYLPPAASEQVVQYESAPSYSAAASEPAVAYEATSYESAASEPAHSYSSADGYRYKSVKHRVLRRQRRDVSHLSSEYLPPYQGAASSLSGEYLPPGAATNIVAQYESAPSYSVAASAPVASYETASYDASASEPAHTFSSSDGYRYKTVKRRVIRRNRL